MASSDEMGCLQPIDGMALADEMGMAAADERELLRPMRPEWFRPMTRRWLGTMVGMASANERE